MKALVKEKPQKGAVLKDLETPKIKENEVLVKVKRAAICGSDIHFYQWTPFAQQRVKTPRIIGHELCGEVVEVGDKVKRVRKGDLVSAETHIPCGNCFQCDTGLMYICPQLKTISLNIDGAFSEYCAIPEICAWKLSPGTSPDIGAIYEPFGVAVHALSMHKVAGKRILITGAGPIGLFTVAVAKLSGAAQVISADISDERLKLASNIGATSVINPKKIDMVKEVESITGGFGVDIFVELSGSGDGLRNGFKVLRKGGAVSLVGISDEPVELDFTNDVLFKGATIYGIYGRVMFSNWAEASDIIDSGQIDLSPIITHHFPLEDFDNAFELAASATTGKILFDIG